MQATRMRLKEVCQGTSILWLDCHCTSPLLELLGGCRLFWVVVQECNLNLHCGDVRGMYGFYALSYDEEDYLEPLPAIHQHRVVAFRKR